MQSASGGQQKEILRVSQSRAETRAFYNKISKFYDLLAQHAEAPVREAGLQMLDTREGERVLEIGFGTGHCLAILAKVAGREGRVYGIDLSNEMLQRARENLEEEALGERVEILCGDATDLPYASASMDAVFMSFVLELFDTPEIPKVLGECKRVLRRGGRIVVVGLSKEGPGGLLLRIFEWTHRNFPNLVDCRPIFIRRALEASGFVIEESAIKRRWVPAEVVLAVKT